ILAGTGHARRTLLSKGVAGGTLVRTAGPGICGYAAYERGLTAGCWDRHLSPQWIRTVPFQPDPRAPSPDEDIRQDGPFDLILPDLTVSWRDGTVTREQALATVEDARGKRVDPATVRGAL